jgi:hypothetical protein
MLFNRVNGKSRFKEFDDSIWARFDPKTVAVMYNGSEHSGVDSLPIIHRFLPPPGWKGHIELETETQIG